MVQKRKRKKSWISWLILLVLLVVAGVICYLVWDNYCNDKKTSSEDNQEQIIEKEENPEKKEEELKDNENNDEKKVVQYEGDDPNTKEELSGTVTYADKIDNKVIVRLNIDQYLNEGKCEIVLINNGANAYSETVEIVGAASTSTCEGFDIPIVNLASGKYDIVVNLSSGEKKGKIVGEVNI